MSRVVHNLAAWLAAAGLTACSTCWAAESAGDPLPKAITNSINLKLVLIPAGEFLMGSPRFEADRNGRQVRRRVRITRPFYLGAYEVTQGEYERVMGANPSYLSATGGGKDRVSGQDSTRFPVEYVSWENAVGFCQRLSEMPGEMSAGRVYRLPTEAEWEYACRARTKGPFHFGAALNGRKANCAGDYPFGTVEKGPNLQRPATVGTYPPNAFGLYDMHGNVWEWCADGFADYACAESTLHDPQGPTDVPFMVVRGGGWGTFPGRCRAASRSGNQPTGRYGDTGFRVALTQ